MTTPQQTLQQMRAADAHAKIQGLPQGQDSSKEYGSLVRSFPAMIQTDGLGQALTFLKAKRKEHHLALYDHVSKWVMGQMKQEGDLLEWLLKQDTAVYRRATVETQAYVIWLKRFAEARQLGSD